ncbi:hypothetical protein DL93DRAFT_372059 [Clavulina sp. PMI_390]|nr:hypothetical protein DL93DRAFT_372059 [Clavulina sp. PMI_390]
MKRASSSLNFSPNFSLVLPTPSTTPRTSTSAPNPTEPTYPQIPPSTLFLPPPFTPADPIFVHLSSHAQTVSDNARLQAQAELDTFMRRKVEEVAELDRRLRKEVDALWATWRSSWNEVVAPTLSPEQRRSNLNGPSPIAAPASSDSTQPSTAPALTNGSSFKPIAPISIRGGFDAIKDQRVSSEDEDEEEGSPRQPSTLSRITNSDTAGTSSSLSVISHPHQTPDASDSRLGRSPRMPLPRRSSGGISSSLSRTPAGEFSHAPSPLALSPRPMGRILYGDTTDESRAIAASYQIRMGDHMAPAQAAQLARMGVPATYDQEVEEEQELAENPPANLTTPSQSRGTSVVRLDNTEPITPLPPTQKASSNAPQSPVSPKSPGAKKHVSFRAMEKVPEQTSKREPKVSTSRNDEREP